MSTPINTQPSPNLLPVAIVPPFITTESIPPPLTNAQRQDIPEMAEAVTLYGMEYLPLVLKTYAITREQFDAHVSNSPVYTAASALSKAQLEEDPHLTTRKKAKVMLDNHLVTLSSVAANADDSKDRINAVKLLAEIADIGPRKQKQDDTKGMQVNVNFGQSLGTILYESKGA